MRNKTDLAIATLDEARLIHISRENLLKAGIKRFGYIGPRISGCEQEHFPEDLKQELRRMAYAWAEKLDQSRSYWREAGRQLRTWKRLKDNDPRLFCYF